MSEEPIIRLWKEPPAQETGSSLPTVATSKFDLLLGYYTRNKDFPDWKSGAEPEHPGFKELVAVIRFRLILVFKFGYPNSEALHGHPLYKYGLKNYCFHFVQNSPWIAELRAQNRIHPQHNDTRWDHWQHWIATFEDWTLEAIAESASVVGNFDSISPAEAIRKVAG